MLRQAVKLSVAACHATSLAVRTTGRTSLPPFTTHTTHHSRGSSLAAASAVVVTPLRWSSFNAAKAGESTGDEPVKNNNSVVHANLPVEESPPSAPSVAEQLSKLSANDQQRIIAALQQPEKEKSSVMGGAGIGPADGDMVAAFTCGPCEYRMVKRFSKHAYTKGIVIVECPNCGAKHLLADNLGWFMDEARNIEDMLREKGESFIRIGGTTGDYQVVGASDDASPATPSAKQE